jgi:hypothetical protein
LLLADIDRVTGVAAVSGLGRSLLTNMYPEANRPPMRET